MDPGAWQLGPHVDWIPETSEPLRFARYEGMPDGAMTVSPGIAVSRQARFSSGTIDFDIKPLAYDDTGIIFRRHGEDAGEMVYLRANPDCPAADDCIQYAPITHQRMQWDTYSNYQGQAPINPAGWNHVHLVVAGEKLTVTVNHAADPTLVVPRLQGTTTEGGIAFKGPAIYANLVIRPGPASALPDVHEGVPAADTVMTWLAATPSALPVDRPVGAADIPASRSWHAIAAEQTGLVNLSRNFNVRRLSVGWLKTTITAGTAMHRVLRIGWARQITVFLNGKAVFAGDNPYRPEDRRLSPNGRLEADNASVPIALRQGANDIVLAVGNTWLGADGHIKPTAYGWGAEARLEELRQ